MEKLLIEVILITIIAGMIFGINYPDSKRAKEARQNGYLYVMKNGVKFKK